jgi:catechol 2,3-dioxygenase-like lactoylglutathione lyase family enzyme
VSGAVPFLRVRDAEASADWYRRLGFEVDWTHRFEPGLPLFVAIRNGPARLFLSEHEGDAVPRTLVYLYVDDADELARTLGEQAEDTPYGMRELELADPDGNRLRIGSPPLPE